MRRSRTLATALVVLALGVAGCDNAADTDTNKPDPIATSGGGDKGPGDLPSDASPSTPRLIDTPNMSTFNVTKPDGTTYTVIVETGKVRPATKGLATGDPGMDYDKALKEIGKIAVLGEGCGDVNLTAKSRDAVVPIKLTIDDTTPGGYRSDPEIVTDVYVRDTPLDPQHDVELRQFVHTPNGYECPVAGGADQATTLMGTRTDENTVVLPSWLVLPDYGNSDPAKFKDVKIAFSTVDGDGRATFTDATGYFSVREDRDPTNGELYTKDVAMNLADLIG